MFPTSTVPPNGNGVVVNDEDLVPFVFVGYTDDGRVGDHFTEAFYFFKQRLAKGEPIVQGDGKPDTHYVQFIGIKRAPLLTVRDELPYVFDKLVLGVREPTTMAELPPAKVAFSGPVSGEHQHPGGDLVVGWTVPGTYTVTVEAFPYLVATFPVTVGDGK